MAWFQFKNKTKQKQKNKKKIRLLKGGGHIPLRHPLCASANHSLMSKPGPRSCLPIKKPIHNEWAFIIRPNIILYRTTSNDFAEKRVLKMKEKLCEERRFGVLKTLKTQELPGKSYFPASPKCWFMLISEKTTGFVWFIYLFLFYFVLFDFWFLFIYLFIYLFFFSCVKRR